jgi:hypothetical protein
MSSRMWCAALVCWCNSATACKDQLVAIVVIRSKVVQAVGLGSIAAELDSLRFHRYEVTAWQDMDNQ